MESTNSTHIYEDRPTSNSEGFTVSLWLFLVLSSSSIVINSCTLSAFLCRKSNQTVATRHLAVHFVVSDIVYVLALYVTHAASMVCLDGCYSVTPRNPFQYSRIDSLIFVLYLCYSVDVNSCTLISIKRCVDVLRRNSETRVIAVSSLLTLVTFLPVYIHKHLHNYSEEGNMFSICVFHHDINMSTGLYLTQMNCVVPLTAMFVLRRRTSTKLRVTHRDRQMFRRIMIGMRSRFVLLCVLLAVIIMLTTLGFHLSEVLAIIQGFRTVIYSVIYAQNNGVFSLCIRRKMFARIAKDDISTSQEIPKPSHRVLSYSGKEWQTRDELAQVPLPSISTVSLPFYCQSNFHTIHAEQRNDGYELSKRMSFNRRECNSSSCSRQATSVTSTQSSVPTILRRQRRRVRKGSLVNCSPSPSYWNSLEIPPSGFDIGRSSFESSHPIVIGSPRVTTCLSPATELDEQTPFPTTIATHSRFEPSCSSRQSLVSNYSQLRSARSSMSSRISHYLHGSSTRSSITSAYLATPFSTPSMSPNNYTIAETNMDGVEDTDTYMTDEVDEYDNEFPLTPPARDVGLLAMKLDNQTAIDNWLSPTDERRVFLFSDLAGCPEHIPRRSVRRVTLTQYSDQTDYAANAMIIAQSAKRFKTCFRASVIELYKPDTPVPPAVMQDLQVHRSPVRFMYEEPLPYGCGSMFKLKPTMTHLKVPGRQPPRVPQTIIEEDTLSLSHPTTCVSDSALSRKRKNASSWIAPPVIDVMVASHSKDMRVECPGVLVEHHS